MEKDVPDNLFDVLVVGAGAAGLNCALHLPETLRVLVVCKGGLKESDSFLAQGGICMLRGEDDFEDYFNDTMRAGHWENDPATVRCMIENSQETIRELAARGVRFAREKTGELRFTREGGHGKPRIAFHADCTGKEISSRLLAAAKGRGNIALRPETTMLDLICGQDGCLGAVMRENGTGKIYPVYAGATVLATGGVGGLFRNSTNMRLLTGDGLAVCYRRGVAVDHADYVQIHPTTLYGGGRGRRFLISESVRGEGARLLNAKGERFVDELLPRDLLTAAIRTQMEKEGSKFVRLDLSSVRGGKKTLLEHFPSIVRRCAKEGYDVMRDPVPVVPAQHYFMGGIRSDLWGRTTMPRLYAVGETCCNGVHGKNRLASNSLLEALIFAKRAAEDIAAGTVSVRTDGDYDPSNYADLRKLKEQSKEKVRREVHGGIQ